MRRATPSSRAVESQVAGEIDLAECEGDPSVEEDLADRIDVEDRELLFKRDQEHGSLRRELDDADEIVTVGRAKVACGTVGVDPRRDRRDLGECPVGAELVEEQDGFGRLPDNHWCDGAIARPDERHDASVCALQAAAEQELAERRAGYGDLRFEGACAVGPELRERLLKAAVEGLRAGARHLPLRPTGATPTAFGPRQLLRLQHGVRTLP